MTLRETARRAGRTMSVLPGCTLLVAAILAEPASAGRGAERTVERWAEAIGGTERLKKIESIHTWSAIEAAGLQGSLEEWIVRDGRRRTDLDLEVFKTLTVFGKDRCWNVGPHGKRTITSGDELKSEITGSYTSTWSHLLPGRMSGSALYEGEDSTGAVESIVFSPDGGSAIRYRIDRATGLPLSSTNLDDTHGMTIRYGDWQPVEEVLMAHQITQWTREGKLYATTTLKEVHVNSPLDDTLFDRPGESAADLAYTSGRASRSIPFTLHGNHILIDVSVNGSGPVPMVFDTGAQMSVIDAAWAEELNLDLEGQIQGMGAGEETIELSLAEVHSLSVQGVELKNQLFATLSLDPFRAYSGDRWYGILGYNFISRFVVEIDFEKRLIHLMDPDGYVYDGGGDELPLTIEHQHPQVFGSLEWGNHDSEDFHRFEGRFLVDTGHGGQLTINRKFIESNNILSVVGETLEAPLGFGAGGEVKGVFGRIPHVRLGRFEIENPVAGFTSDRGGALGTFSSAGVLGTEILRQFTVIFDYNGQRMILEKNGDFGNPLEHDMFGATLMLEEPSYDKILIRAVLENSPAADGGLRAGDRIESFNGKPAEPKDFQSLRESMKREGTAWKLTVERKGRSFETTVITRRMI